MRAWMRIAACARQSHWRTRSVLTVTVTNLSQASPGRPSPRALKPRLRYKLRNSYRIPSLHAVGLRLRLPYESFHARPATILPPPRNEKNRAGLFLGRPGLSPPPAVPRLPRACTYSYLVRALPPCQAGPAACLFFPRRLHCTTAEACMCRGSKPQCPFGALIGMPTLAAWPMNPSFLDHRFVHQSNG